MKSLQSAAAWINEELDDARSILRDNRRDEGDESLNDYYQGVIAGLEMAAGYIQEQINNLNTAEKA
mgnify:CR=1 FL=1